MLDRLGLSVSSSHCALLPQTKRWHALFLGAVIMNATARNAKLTGSQVQLLAELPEEPQEGFVDG